MKGWMDGLQDEMESILRNTMLIIQNLGRGKMEEVSGEEEYGKVDR